MIKDIPGYGILGHELVETDIVVVGPERTVVGVEVDNVALDPAGVKNVKGISKGICRGTVPTSCIRHENLNSANILSVEYSCRSRPEGGQWTG